MPITHSTKHGQNSNGCPTPEYRAWQAMKSRCNRPTDKDYHGYGGRGIKVCDRWQLFENFFADMGKKPSPEHSLDRFPDVNGHYEPENCRWATERQQQSNRRDNIWIEYEGRKMIQADWARELKIYPSQLFTSLKRKSFEKIYKERMAKISKSKQP